jgi:ribosome-binding protein aMBF1 (putative translation factor)
VSAGAAFQKYLDEQLADPEFKKGFDRELAHLQAFVELVRAFDRARERQKLSKKDVADRMGRHPSAVSRLLKGDGANPTLETIADMADAVGVQVSIHIRPLSKSAQKTTPSVAVKTTI